MRAAGLACGPVNSLADVMADPQLRHRRMVAQTWDAKGKEYWVPGNPVKISGYEDPLRKPAAPALDEHGAKIRSSL